MFEKVNPCHPCHAILELIKNHKKNKTMRKRIVTEEMRPQDEWFERAGKIETLRELKKFAKELFDKTAHDYGIACHAVAALALAGAWYGAHKEGITGFQAGFVMWDFIRQWNYPTNKCGMCLIDYDNFLYPQYGVKFEKIISKETWAAIQAEAQRRLQASSQAHPAVIRHWQSIVDGVVPFGFSIKGE